MLILNIIYISITCIIPYLVPRKLGKSPKQISYTNVTNVLHVENNTVLNYL